MTIPEVQHMGGLTISKYNSIHIYIRSHFGKPTHCSIGNCKYPDRKMFEWALIKGRSYSKNIEDYMPLCPSCHRKYDETEEQNKRKSQSAKKLMRGDNRAAKIVLNVETGIFYDCAIDAAESAGMNPYSLRYKLSGWSPNNTKFIYA